MVAGIFTNIWEGIKEFGDDAYNFIMNNYDQPFFWLIIFGVMLALGLFGISKFADK